MVDIISLQRLNPDFWSHHALKDLKVLFYACIYFLEQQQWQQEPDPTFEIRQEQANHVDCFLDRLALLWAPAKKKHTEHNVTATALVKHKTSGILDVYIAKNDGPQEHNKTRKNDENLANMLEYWLNLETNKHCQEGDDNEYWLEILHYWKQRIEFYQAGLRSTPWADINASKASIQQYLRAANTNFEEDWFDEEWLEVSKLVKSTQEREITGNQPEDWDSYYRFWSRSSRQQYPQRTRHEATEDEKAAHKYIRYVYQLEMLAMPLAIWNAFVKFRNLKGATNTVKIYLLEKPNLGAVYKTLDKVGILRMLHERKWTGRPENLAFIRELESSTRRELFFHCELQILLLFHELKEGDLSNDLYIHKFIGCSKLSCFLCWEILKERKYKTRGSHYKISANCAFPFPTDLKDIVDTFRKMLKKYENQVAIQGQDRLPQFAKQLDTDPAHTARVKLTTVRERLAQYNAKELSPGQPQFPFSKRTDRPVGKGTFATVYAASRKSERTSGVQVLYALKEIKIESKSDLDCMEEEIKILANINHRNILSLDPEGIFFSLHDSGNPVIHLATFPWAPLTLELFFLDLLHNCKYPSWWSENELDPWPAIISQCLSGLSYLHSEKIKHRDLKPHNILLCLELRPFRRTEVYPIIADFNISKSNFQPGDMTDKSGTSVYKAPELSRPGEASDFSSDMWSLGCCFALIFILIVSSRDELRHIWDTVIDSSHEKRGFYRPTNREEVFKACHPLEIKLHRAEDLEFITRLLHWIKRMLQMAPYQQQDRPSSKEVNNDIQTHMLLRKDLKKTRSFVEGEDLGNFVYSNPDIGKRYGLDQQGFPGQALIVRPPSKPMLRSVKSNPDVSRQFEANEEYRKFFALFTETLRDPSLHLLVS